MQQNNRKRPREEFDTEQDNETNEELINCALKEIWETNKISEPTKKKVRIELQFKLDVSKSYIKQNKKLINSLIEHYWISPPKMSNKSGMSILSIPDHIQQYFFLMLHPKSMYFSLPSVCKWWYHLLHKETFLHSLCINMLQINPQKIPIPLHLRSIRSYLKNACLKCGNYNTFNNIYHYGASGNTQNMVCWKYQICQICFDINPELQGIYWMNAKQIYKLNDGDLYCCKFQKRGRIYLLHSDVIQVTKNKYGDISRIHSLSSLEIDAINTQRKRCYNKKCNELKKELEVWLNKEFELKHNEDVNLEQELNQFFLRYHGGYDFFTGAHCQQIVDNFDRKYMHLVQDISEIKKLLNDHINEHIANKTLSNVRRWHFWEH